MKYDYLVVGAGYFGCTFARVAAENKKSVLLLDKGPIGGSAHDTIVDGTPVCKMGAHIVHTNDEAIWKFMNRFATFNNYVHRVKALSGGKFWSFPVNLNTLNQLWGVTTVDEAKRVLSEKQIAIENPGNLEEWILSKVGHEIYELFVHDYTIKQWGRHPRDLPASVFAGRVPIRMNHDDRYFATNMQGLPIGGFSKMCVNMIDHPLITFEQAEFDENHTSDKWRGIAKHLVHSGSIDRFFDNRLGRLEYRCMNFIFFSIDSPDFYGTPVVNFTDSSTPYVRAIEHRHFYEGCKWERSVINYDVPVAHLPGTDPLYPVCTERNIRLHREYCNLLPSDVTFSGRIGGYKYLDICQTIGQATNHFHKLNR